MIRDGSHCKKVKHHTWMHDKYDTVRCMWCERRITRQQLENMQALTKRREAKRKK